MLTLKELCHPRASIFDPQRRDTVLDLQDLIHDRIDPRAFFEENYATEGMKTLLEQAFRRLAGKSQQGVFKLRQAMGGGKTHNLLVLGLLARHPEIRKEVLQGIFEPDPTLGSVKVVAFSGRESDAPLGIWGALAEQMGRRDHFKDCYSPLRAPGQTAWENLFAGQTVLILLDELPPYFQQARSVPIGGSNLAEVTATALSNLLVALGRPSCERVCLVLTDLAAAYEQGQQLIASVLHDFEAETHRSAMSIEPVRLNSDELYHILRKRIFQSLPPQEKIREVAQAYAAALRKARQMDLIAESPEEFATRVESSYPFHPAIRDLYARFRENPGFQQTRGLIRLMRIVTARLWNTNLAARRYLIAAHDLDLNDQDVRAEIAQINHTLDNAIAHDIASDGAAVAEQLDHELGTTDATDATKLLLVSSLANVHNAVLGLSIPELIAYLCEPGRDITRLKRDVLDRLATAAWYLHSTRDGKLYFRNIQNLNAKLESLVKAFVSEQALDELRKRLQEIFRPVTGWCYQKLQILPAADEIELEQEKVTLVVTEPHTGGLRPELKKLWEDTQWKNRLGILTGSRNTYEQLIDVGKRLRAIQAIRAELREEGLADREPQMLQAAELEDRIRQQFHSAVRETFTTIWYPTKGGLLSADFLMKFEGNRYNGEEQIVAVLKEKYKFTDDITGEVFRKKVEQRLFTQQVMKWSEVKRRAATNPGWQWHKPDALDRLKEECLAEDRWRETDGYVDKGPFPQPATDVVIKEIARNDATGEVELHVTPVHGDTIYYDVGAEATTASRRLEGSKLSTKELRVSFLCVDSRGVHETGPAKWWTNRITLQYRLYQEGEDKRVELKAAPEAEIRYTTDGTSPRLGGARYEGPFLIRKPTSLVLAYAYRDGIESEVLHIPIDWEQSEEIKIERELPARLLRKQKTQTTQETYGWLDALERHRGEAQGLTLTVMGQGTDRNWVELTTFQEMRFSAERIREALKFLRELHSQGQVTLEAQALCFPTGQDLLDWVADVKTELSPGEVKQ
ncbi:MAG: DUF499 domain-containing protein [Acidobacteriota bacterium]